MKRKGLSLIDIGNKLDNSPNAENNKSNAQSIDLLSNQLVEMVKSAVYRFFEGESLN